VIQCDTKGGSERNLSRLEDCHQNKQVILLTLPQPADLQLCAPGRTRTCNLRIRSKPRPVHLMLPWSIAAGRVWSAVQLVTTGPVV
jgi:hypothetical protein